MSAGKPEVTLKVRRFDPQTREEARYQEYKIPFESGMNVLQALNYVYSNIDPTLAFRNFSCGKGICRSCLMQIDGQKKRACSTVLRESETATVEPLPGCEVVRDLVTV